jgi:hypothetical protein
MSDLTALLSALRRPRLLVRAAQHGIAHYDRNRDLRRLLSGAAPVPEVAVTRLIEAEDGLETARREGGASYSVARHVEVMIAILAEMRLVNRRQAV